MLRKEVVVVMTVLVVVVLQVQRLQRLWNMVLNFHKLHVQLARVAAKRS
jgi:hypothetical protein